jgi:hypothetical protein
MEEELIYTSSEVGSSISSPFVRIAIGGTASQKDKTKSG